MISNNYVSEYIRQYRDGEIKLNKERVMLMEHLEQRVLVRDDIYFDEDMINNFVKFTEKWYFPLQSFQKFIVAFIFLYYKDDDVVFYQQFFLLMARGAGKNGLISALSHFFISELHGVPKYNISIVANSELQAKTSFKEVYDIVADNDILGKMFRLTKVEIEGMATRGILQYHTSNAGSKDGLRDGCVIYDEVHRYETADIVNVFSSGLGKVPDAREFFIGTEGFVREGFLDKLKERSINILEGKDMEDPLFPFICSIDEPEELDDLESWEKANPMFSEPMCDYAKGLYRKVVTQYKQLSNNPSSREEFMTKRMNYPEVDLTKTVAPWGEILATDRPFPNLEHMTAVGSLDFASIRDFAAVGLLFKKDDDYIFKTHSFARKEFLDIAKLKAPIYDWEKQGHLTIVDEPIINIEHIVKWFVEARELYGVNTIVADTFRLDLVKTALEAEGFELVYIRNPSAIHSLLAPRVETLFANNNIIFGNNPLMRWYTNNVFVRIKKDGNKEYLKKDEFRRKTDGFQAFIHALYKADDILEEDVDFFIADIKF